jgi:hypothetical protein
MQYYKVVNNEPISEDVNLSHLFISFSFGNSKTHL